MNISDLKVKKIKRDIKSFVESKNFSLNETDTHWFFRKGCIEISLKKSKVPSVDKRRTINIINEALGQGYSDSGSFGWNGQPYCEYKIIPLNHNLEQKIDRETVSQNSKKEQRNIIIGNFVVGKSKVTGKEYSGIVQRFVRTNYNDIVTVYILARENGRIIGLDPDTVHLSAPYAKERINRSKLNMGNLNIGGVGAQIGGISK